MGDSTKIKNNGVALANGVVLTTNGLGHAKNHGPVELEEEHTTLARIQQSLLLLR